MAFGLQVWPVQECIPGSKFTEVTGEGKEKSNFCTFRLRHAQGYSSCVAVGSISAVTSADIE